MLNCRLRFGSELYGLLLKSLLTVVLYGYSTTDCSAHHLGQGNSGATTVTARVGKDDVQEILENMADGGTLVLEYEDGDVLAGLYNDKSVTVKGQGKTGPILRCPNPCRNCPMFLNE